MICIKHELNKISKYLPELRRASLKYNVSINILISIAILENINRPQWVRFIEKILPSKIYKVKTHGLMQVNSVNHIDDNESIDKSARIVSILINSSNDIAILGMKYNGSSDYGRCLKYIYELLGTY